MKICASCSELYPDDAQFCPECGAELKKNTDKFLGRTIAARYRLIRRLGAGGMSVVYLARHVIIERLSAIKILRQDLGLNPAHRERFLREARAVNRINHRNIVEITDVGEADGVAYLVMEYVQGESLLAALQPGAMPWPRGVKIAIQVASALARAHQMNVIHRDLKPENIMLVPEFREDAVKLMDFGIAKMVDLPALTFSEQLFGTPGYIAPEYIQSANIDGRSDLYSLGVILYEMVCAALPFDYEYPGDLLVKHVTEQPIPPSERHRGVEKPVEELVMRCLRKKPDERFLIATNVPPELTNSYAEIPRAERLGDLLFYTRTDGTLLHSAAYVASDYVFTKNGFAHHAPWSLQRLADVRATYLTEGNVEPLVIEHENGKTYEIYGTKRQVVGRGGKGSELFKRGKAVRAHDRAPVLPVLPGNEDDAKKRASRPPSSN